MLRRRSTGSPPVASPDESPAPGAADLSPAILDLAISTEDDQLNVALADDEGAAPTESAAPYREPVDPEALLDERLIRAAQKGELASFNALVFRHERTVFNVCLRLLRDVGLAEDA